MNEHDQRVGPIHAIISAAREAYRERGHGFLAAVNPESLALESTAVSLPTRSSFAGKLQGGGLACDYVAAFLYVKEFVVETKV